MNDTKLTLISGLLLTVFGAVYLRGASVPSTETTAILFPVSILALLIGIVLLIWGAIRFARNKTRK